MTFAFIDVIFLVIIFFCAIDATIHGFLHEFFTKAAFLLGIFVASMFFKKLSEFINPFIKIQLLSKIIAFALIFIVVYLIVRIIQQCLKNCFESDIMKGLDRGLGFLFGVVEGLVYVGLILVVLYAQPWFNVNGLLDKSFFHNLLGALLSAPADSLRSMVINV
jgi:membrane protein required for colicin V production